MCQECSKIFPLGVTALFDHKVSMHGLGSKESDVKVIEINDEDVEKMRSAKRKRQEPLKKSEVSSSSESRKSLRISKKIKLPGANVIQAESRGSVKEQGGDDKLKRQEQGHKDEIGTFWGEALRPIKIREIRERDKVEDLAGTEAQVYPDQETEHRHPADGDAG